MSTRARLTLFQTLVLLLSLVLVTGALRLLTARALVRGLDSSLTAAIELVQVDREGGRPAFAQQGEQPDVTRGIIALDLFDASGVRTGHLGPAAAGLPAPSGAGLGTVGAWRVRTVTVPGGWLRAARSTREVRATLDTMDRLLLAGIPAMALLAALAGLWLTGQALRPVEAVARTARAIAASGDASARVPAARGRDEMARLIEVVNAMLARLQAVIARERSFANGAAHELRTPVAVLRARTALALETAHSAPEARAALTDVEAEVADLQRVLEGLLALARSGTVRPERGDLAAAAAAALEDAEPALGARGVSVRAELAPTPVFGDEALLRSAVAALLDNAVKYGRAGGRLALRCRPERGVAVCEVEDDGEGIAEDDRERLLQPFQRGYGRQGVAGSGLGLALVREIVDAHGGEVTLARGAWGGLRVRLAVPTAAGAGRPGRPAPG